MTLSNDFYCDPTFSELAALRWVNLRHKLGDVIRVVIVHYPCVHDAIEQGFVVGQKVSSVSPAVISGHKVKLKLDVTAVGGEFHCFRPGECFMP